MALGKILPARFDGWRALTQPLRARRRKLLAGSLSQWTKESRGIDRSKLAQGNPLYCASWPPLIVPTRGHATLGGFDVERQAAELAASWATIRAEMKGLQPCEWPRELAFFAAMNNLSAASHENGLAALPESMGIQDDLDRQVRTFSTGMMHRLG